MQNSYRARLNFNPRSPQGGATIAGGLADLTRELFQSTLPARGSDAEQRERFKAMRIISIHAPRKGERRPKAVPWSRSLNFNPRSPRGGATVGSTEGECPYKDFNPRSPRGGATSRRHRGGGGKKIFQSTLPTRGSDLFAGARRKR